MHFLEGFITECMHHMHHKNVMTSTQSQNKNKNQGSLASLSAVESIWPFLQALPQNELAQRLFFQQKLLLSKFSICSRSLSIFSIQGESPSP